MCVVILKAIFLGKVKVDEEKTNNTTHLGKGKADQQYVVFKMHTCFRRTVEFVFESASLVNYDDFCYCYRYDEEWKYDPFLQ